MSASGATLASLNFELPDRLIAAAPVEAGGGRRDDARLLVSWRSDERLVHTTFAHVSEHLRAGDVVVVNTSATLPAAVPTNDGLLVHLSTELPGGRWLVELRRPCRAGSLPYADGRPDAPWTCPDAPRCGCSSASLGQVRDRHACG